MAKRLGIDIGGSSIKLALVEDGSFRVLRTDSLPLPKQNAFEYLSRTFVDLHRDWFEDVESIGVGVPGILKSDQVVFSNNVPWLENQPILPYLLRYSGGAPGWLSNDTNCHAVSMVPQLTKPGLYCSVALGSGVGGGIVSMAADGAIQTYIGRNRHCGEIGQIELSVHDVDLKAMRGVPDVNPVEYYLGERSDFWRLLAKHLGLDPVSLGETLQESGKPDGEGIFLQIYGTILAKTLSLYVGRLIDPESISLSGGIPTACPQLATQVTESWKLFGPKNDPITPEVRINQYGHHGGAVGAALLYVCQGDL